MRASWSGFTRVMLAPRIRIQFSFLNFVSVLVMVSLEVPHQARQFFMGQRHGDANVGPGCPVRTRPLQKHRGEPSRRRGGECETPCLEESGLIFVRKRLRSMSRSLAGLAQERAAVGSRHHLDLDWFHGLSRYLVRAPRERCTQPENIARTSNLQDHGATVAGGAKQLQEPRANDRHIPAWVAFPEQHSARLEPERRSHMVETGQRFRREIAKRTPAAQSALDAGTTRHSICVAHRTPQCECNAAAAPDAGSLPDSGAHLRELGMMNSQPVLLLSCPGRRVLHCEWKEDNVLRAQHECILAWFERGLRAH